MTVDDILDRAVKKGLDGIAICDHNTVAGSYHAKKRAQELNSPLLVLAGMEVSTSEGHLLVLGIRENIPPDLTPGETIRIAKEKGGVVIAAHPFKSTGIGNVEGLDVDAIETFNSRCIFGENRKALEMAKSLGKPQVGGSDSHMLSMIGACYTEIDAYPYEESVLSAIREGRTVPKGRLAPYHMVLIHGIRGLFRKIWNRG